MPQIKTEEILTKLSDIEKKIDQIKLTSIRQWQWGASIGFAFMIASLAIIFNAPVFQKAYFGAAMLLGGAIILFISVRYKSKS